jgi:hypothetical protein
MGWYLLQIGVYVAVAWSDIRYRWTGWRHGDPIWPILLLELAAMWSVTRIVSSAIDAVLRWRGRQSPKRCGKYDVVVRARLGCGPYGRQLSSTKF